MPGAEQGQDQLLILAVKKNWLFQFHLSVISLCFAMVTLEEQSVLLLVDVTEQEFVIQERKACLFGFKRSVSVALDNYQAAFCVY